MEVVVASTPTTTTPITAALVVVVVAFALAVVVPVLANIVSAIVLVLEGRLRVVLAKNNRVLDEIRLVVERRDTPRRCNTRRRRQRP